MDFLRFKALEPERKVLSHKPSASVSSIARQGNLDSRIEDDLRSLDGDGGCILTLDIRNAYGQPFDVTLERTEDSFKNRQRIEPGATASMMLPMKKLSLRAEALDRPIPALTERQFVVSKSQTSPSKEKISRELFWYREEVLKLVKASWREVGTLRHGTVSLRSLRFTAPMMEILRADDIQIQLSLRRRDQPSREREAPPSTYTAYTTEFMDIVSTISNRSVRKLNLHLRLDLLPHPPELLQTATGRPAAVDLLSRYIAIDGITSLPLRSLEPDESETVCFPICFLAEGEFNFGCSAEEIAGTGHDVHSSQTPLIIHVIEK